MHQNHREHFVISAVHLGPLSFQTYQHREERRLGFEGTEIENHRRGMRKVL